MFGKFFSKVVIFSVFSVFSLVTAAQAAQSLNSWADAQKLGTVAENPYGDGGHQIASTTADAVVGERVKVLWGSTDPQPVGAVIPKGSQIYFWLLPYVGSDGKTVKSEDELKALSSTWRNDRGGILVYLKENLQVTENLTVYALRTEAWPVGTVIPAHSQCWVAVTTPTPTPTPTKQLPLNSWADAQKLGTVAENPYGDGGHQIASTTADAVVGERVKVLWGSTDPQPVGAVIPKGSQIYFWLLPYVGSDGKTVKSEDELKALSSTWRNDRGGILVYLKENLQVTENLTVYALRTEAWPVGTVIPAHSQCWVAVTTPTPTPTPTKQLPLNSWADAQKLGTVAENPYGDGGHQIASTTADAVVGERVKVLWGSTDPQPVGAVIPKGSQIYFWLLPYVGSDGKTVKSEDELKKLAATWRNDNGGLLVYLKENLQVTDNLTVYALRTEAWPVGTVIPAHAQAWVAVDSTPVPINVTIKEAANWEELAALTQAGLSTTDRAGKPTTDGGRLGRLKDDISWRVTDCWRVLSGSAAELRTGELVEAGAEFYAWFIGGDEVVSSEPVDLDRLNEFGEVKDTSGAWQLFTASADASFDAIAVVAMVSKDGGWVRQTVGTLVASQDYWLARAEELDNSDLRNTEGGLLDLHFPAAHGEWWQVDSADQTMVVRIYTPLSKFYLHSRESLLKVEAVDTSRSFIVGLESNGRAYVQTVWLTDPGRQARGDLPPLGWIQLRVVKEDDGEEEKPSPEPTSGDVEPKPEEKAESAPDPTPDPDKDTGSGGGGGCDAGTGSLS